MTIGIEERRGEERRGAVQANGKPNVRGGGGNRFSHAPSGLVANGSGGGDSDRESVCTHHGARPSGCRAICRPRVSNTTRQDRRAALSCEEEVGGPYGLEPPAPHTTVGSSRLPAHAPGVRGGCSRP